MRDRAQRGATPQRAAMHRNDRRAFSGYGTRPTSRGSIIEPRRAGIRRTQAATAGAVSTAASARSTRLQSAPAALWHATPATRADALRALRPYVETELARGTALRHMARHWLGLYQGLPGARSFRRLLGEQGRAAGADWSLVERALAAVETAPAVAA